MEKSGKLNTLGKAVSLLLLCSCHCSCLSLVSCFEFLGNSKEFEAKCKKHHQQWNLLKGAMVNARRSCGNDQGLIALVPTPQSAVVMKILDNCLEYVHESPCLSMCLIHGYA